MGYVHNTHIHIVCKHACACMNKNNSVCVYIYILLKGFFIVLLVSASNFYPAKNICS